MSGNTSAQLNRASLLAIIEKERPMRQPADQVVAAAILHEPRFSHTKRCIIKSITTSMLLCQQAPTLSASCYVVFLRDLHF